MPGGGGAATPFDAKAHAFVVDLDRPELDAGDRHHLERVLRLRPGAVVTVSDGAGGWRPCAFGPELELLGPIEREPRPAPALTVAFAPVKGDRPEWVVQKLTELGVDRIVPITSARSVVRWEGERAARQAARLRLVAREAAMQSRRAWLPEVDLVAPFARIAAIPGAALCERGGRPLQGADALVMVGPEGGWAEEELGAVPDHVGLPGGVLRAETAAVVAAALLCALRGGSATPAL